MERRRGIEPRTPNLQFGRSPLAVAAHGTPGVIRTPNRGSGIRSPHHRQPGRMVGSAGFEPALDTVWACRLCQIGLRACGVRGEIRTRRNAALDRTRLPVAPPEPWWAVKDSNLGDSRGIPGLQPGAFGLSANCPNANCQRPPEGTQPLSSRACFRMPGDTDGVHLTANLKPNLEGNYRLVNRHQGCPAVSR